MGQRDGEIITPTGWRIRGHAAELVSASWDEEEPGAVLTAADVLWAGAFELRAKGREPAVEVVLGALSRAVERVQPGLRPLARRDPFREEADRFRSVAWDAFEHAGRWAGLLSWTHPHPVLGGVPCTTRVGLAEREGRVELTVHVGVEGGLSRVRGFVGAGQARPAWMAELARATLLRWEGGPVEWGTLGEADVESFVRRELLAPRRRVPVAVLAPVEPSGPAEPAAYLVSPDEVAAELLGLARLWVMDRHPTTYRLSDALGDRRLSAYWGALRIYWPGFSCADSGHEHPILLRDRVEDPVERAGLVGQLAQRARLAVALASPVDELRRSSAPPPRPRTPAGPPASPEPLPEPLSGPLSEPRAAPPTASPPLDAQRITEPVVAALEALGRDLGARLEELVLLHDKLLDEVGRLRTATVVRGANAGGVERRLARLERMVRDALEGLPGAAGPLAPPAPVGPGVGAEADDADRDEEAEEAGEGPTLVEVVRQAEAEHADALLILPSALESAAASPYRDPQRVAAHLKAMAELARRRQEGRLGMSLRDAFAEAGVDYRGGIAESTSRRLKAQYLATLPDGRTRLACEEHIVLGTSYDPRWCLRIYFTSRAATDPRFVVAHVGRHLEVMTTT